MSHTLHPLPKGELRLGRVGRRVGLHRIHHPLRRGVASRGALPGRAAALLQVTDVTHVIRMCLRSCALSRKHLLSCSIIGLANRIHLRSLYKQYHHLINNTLRSLYKQYHHLINNTLRSLYTSLIRTRHALQHHRPAPRQPRAKPPLFWHRAPGDPLSILCVYVPDHVSPVSQSVLCGRCPR